jgi:septal ring factor EnvC (AmiA/AmiB activator)
MRRLFVWAVAVVATIATLASSPTRSFAQDQPNNNPEELNRKYQDALAQLKSAQDRKNELAAENEKLNARIADLEKQIDESKRTAATFAEQTYRLRSHYAAWHAFLRRYPLLLEKWKLFIEADPLAVPSSFPDMLDAPTTMPAGE